MAGEFISSSTHPPLPPTTEDVRFDSLRLLRSRRVGVSTYHRLLTEHGTAQNALAALPQVARAAGVSGYDICPETVVHDELRAGTKIGAQLLVYGFEGYPAALMGMAQAPAVLWALGRVELLARPMVSVVGARNASSLGSRMAQAIAKGLGEHGFAVVSGLARGIDAAAHSAALSSGTIAVQAGGVDVLYPAENAELGEKIGLEGLRLSEQPMGLQPMARHFPARNRIIAGLGRASVIVEAALKSGSLITARDALDLGREVLAVPGHPFDARAAGCNALIRDGASLVRNAEDIVHALAPLSDAHQVLEDPIAPDATAPAAVPQSTSELHSQILNRLGPTPIAEDQLIRDLRIMADAIAPALTDLEVMGQIMRHSGGLLSRPV